MGYYDSLMKHVSDGWNWGTKQISKGAKRAGKALLAIQIYNHPSITLATTHSSGNVDDAFAEDNITDTKAFKNAERSCYGNAPCGDITLSTTLMESMLELAKTYNYSVSEIAGGSHSRNSRHYAGVAIDVNQIDGQAVSSSNRHVAGFMRSCRRLGATEVLGPGDRNHDDHVHAAWPRNAD